MVKRFKLSDLHPFFGRMELETTLSAYHGAKQRCTNPNHDSWKYYGGRGIEFRFTSFKQFLWDIGGPTPSPDHTLDRIDNDGHYEPGNVRWATRSVQAGNKRHNYRGTKKRYFGP